MSRPVKLNPTGHLRFIKADSGRDDDVPRLIVLGWPECGPTYYKLQQKWLGTDSSVRWMDVEVVDPNKPEPIDYDRYDI